MLWHQATNHLVVLSYLAYNMDILHSACASCHKHETNYVRIQEVVNPPISLLSTGSFSHGNNAIILQPSLCCGKPGCLFLPAWCGPLASTAVPPGQTWLGYFRTWPGAAPPPPCSVLAQPQRSETAAAHLNECEDLSQPCGCCKAGMGVSQTEDSYDLIWKGEYLQACRYCLQEWLPRSRELHRNLSMAPRYGGPGR